MKKSISLICGVLITAAMAAQNKAAQLDSLFTQLHRNQQFFGNVLIAEKGKVTYQKSFGKADYAANADLDAGSVFELASVSKQFTAMGIMLLKKQGKLSYDDSLRKFIPELPYYNITIRQLLHHTSGLPDYMELFTGNWDTTKIATNKDMVALLAKKKPAVLFAPGEKWEYSNTGYALLSNIIEKASGMTYGDYLQKNIFKPLGMKNTRVFRRRYEQKQLPDYAYGYVYDRSNNKFVLPDSLSEYASMVYCLDGITGDGTVNSTTGDLLKWDRALYTARLVPTEMLNEAFAPGTLNNGKKTNYGFGWVVTESQGWGKVLSHTGGWPGYNTLIERHTDNDVTIIILRNHERQASFLQKAKAIIYEIKDEEVIAQPVSADSLKQYTGEYELAPEFTITITVEQEKIFAQATGQEKFELYKEKTDWFFLKVVEAKIKFVRNTDGAVTSMILYQNGQEVNGAKIK
jgi:CubicO group peptidase (beta-lactamase class C family)